MMKTRLRNRLPWVVLLFTVFIFVSRIQIISQGNIQDRKNEEDIKSGKILLNNFGPNINLRVERDRQRDATEEEIKYILIWNEAYGTKEYYTEFGREPFYTSLCPETRCFATANRSLRPIEEFDAILFHQRSLDWNDIPDQKLRKANQRYIHFILESAQYLYMDIHSMDNFFNWTMTYKTDSDFYRPYGRLVQVKPHPIGQELEEFIAEFGKQNADKISGIKNKTAAWFVSHCATQARRESYVKRLKKHLDVDVYGKCGKMKCPRNNETACLIKLERDYRFYLSFENSICEDYTTEKFFNIMKYNVIPITYSGTNMSSLAPYHSYINSMDFPSVSSLAIYMKEVEADKELYASYFWWKDFYEVRTSGNDSAQAFCELCSALHEDWPPKVYTDLHKWWVDRSRCKKLKLS